MGGAYSNEPSEIAGAICSSCLKNLPPVSGWSDIKIKKIEERFTHEFLEGKYYREKIPSAKHQCWDCFWLPDNIKKQRKEEAEESAKLGFKKLKVEVETFKVEIAKARNELMSSETQLSSVKTELSKVQSKLADARNELGITEDKVTKFKKQLESIKDELAKAKSELAETKRQVQSGELQTTATKEDNTVEESCANSCKITKLKSAVKAMEHVATAPEATDVEDKNANTESSKDHVISTARYPVQVTETSKNSESRDSNRNAIKPAREVDELAQTKLQTAKIKANAEANASEYVATALEAGNAKDEAVKVEDDVTTSCNSARFPSQATENCKDSEIRDSNGNTINTMTVQQLVGRR